MIFHRQQKNKGSRFIKSYSTCLKRSPRYSKGFTIIEAMVAIFILSISVASMLGITASSASSARYSNNEITANFLLQEAVDSIRNSRDTIAFQMKDEPGYGWDKFINRYGYSGNNKCFTTNGCDLIIEDFNPMDLDGKDITDSCSSDGCEYLYYDDVATKLFYNHSKKGVVSEFKRTVKMQTINSDPNQIKITAEVEWLNGNATTPRKQELVSYLLNWQK